MERKSRNGLDTCVKVIEKDDNGKLILLEDGLQKVLAETTKYTPFLPATFLTYVGSTTCDIGLFTRLFAKRAEGDQMWPDVSRSNQNCCQGKSHDGVYWWPQIVSLSQNTNKIVVLVFHVHTDKLDEDNQDDPLHKLVNAISTCCVNISSSKKDYIADYEPFAESGTLRPQLVNPGLNKHFTLEKNDLFCDSRKCDGASFTFFNTMEKVINRLSNEHSVNIRKIKMHLQSSIDNVNDQSFQKKSKYGKSIPKLFYRTCQQKPSFCKSAMQTVNSNKSLNDKDGLIEQQKLQYICNRKREKIKTFYEEEMQDFLAMGKHTCPDLLLEIHNNFLEEMCTELEFSSLEANDGISLAEEIFGVFKRISAANLEIIGRLQNKVCGIIASYKSKYETQIDSIIQTAYSENSKIEFEKEHDSITKHLIMQMTNDIRRETSVSEPVESHIRALEKGILKSSRAFFEKIPSSMLKQTKSQNCTPATDTKGNGLNPNVDEVKQKQENEISVPENPVLQQVYCKKAAVIRISTTNNRDTQLSACPADITQSQEGLERLNPDTKSDQCISRDIKTSPKKPTSTQKSSGNYALLLHLCATKIGLAIVEESSTYNQPEKLHKSLYVSSQFVVTANNKWLYGPYLTTTENIKYQWDIGSFLTKIEHVMSCPESTDTQFNPKVSHLLPLALFLTAVKTNVELKKGVTITRLIVALPRWVPCLNRQLILKAAEQAGFQMNRCILVNEATSAAFHHFKINQLNTPYNTVVVSENSSKIDISMYLYDDKNNHLTLCNHSSKAYKMVNNRHCVFDGPPLKHGWMKWNTPIECFVNVQNALRRAEKGHKPYRSSIALVVAESSTTEKVIEDLLRTDSSEPTVKVQNDWVIFGLSNILNSLIKHEGSSVNLFIKESFHISIKAVPSKSKNLDSNDFVWDHETKFLIDVPYKADPCKYLINQAISGVVFPIGLLKLNESSIPKPEQKPKTLSLEFSCDLNGLMILQKVFYVGEKNKIKELNCSRYTWSTRDISANQVHNETIMFDEIRTFNICAMKLEKQVQVAIIFGNEISSNIKSDQGDFKEPSKEFARILVQRKVDVSLKALMKGISNIEELKHHTDILINLKRQYKL